MVDYHTESYCTLVCGFQILIVLVLRLGVCVVVGDDKTNDASLGKTSNRVRAGALLLSVLFTVDNTVRVCFYQY